MLYSAITPDDHIKRIEKTKAMMKERDLDLLLVYSDAWRSSNSRYLTGYKPYCGYFNVSGYSQALTVIPLEDDPKLFVCDFMTDWAARTIAGTTKEKPFIEIKKWLEIDDTIASYAGNGKQRKVGLVGKEFVPWDLYESMRSNVSTEIQMTDLLDIQRRVKSQKEIKLLEMASNINDLICEELTHGIIRHGITEKQVQRKIEELGHGYGAEYVDANFMKSRDLGWANATDATIDDGDLLSLHVILQYDGYNSDNDRVFGFGKITKQEEELAEITKQAAKNFLSAVKPGASGMDAVIAACGTHDYVAAGEKSSGASGHGIGLDGEECGLISEWTFEEGMAFTMSTGAYNKEIESTWATEDVVVVTESGARKLTKFPIDYIIKR
ncbi:MAG: M24 family metallopeptidase [Candidatus Thermoplasmatota archaeon]|nr:M24 family metallopeptidase [Candidatus Thermoplasmatota archaeon]